MYEKKINDSKGNAPKDQLEKLALLRHEIDSLDGKMHQLLIKRGEIVSQLQQVKGTQSGASAFRPLREAQMMLSFQEKHHGTLPLSLITQLWRVIISTFTYEQSPYAVHVMAKEREAARAHFGFNVPFVESESAEAVIAKVKASKGDLGFLGLEQPSSPWWRALGGKEPMIMATFPVLLPPQAVVIAPSNTDTQGLTHKICVITTPTQDALLTFNNEKLVIVPRDMICDGQIIGYA